MNKLSNALRAYILQLLVEGNGINATVRLTGVSKNTILKLLAETGEACADFHHNHLINLKCRYLQVDEMWSFIHAKKHNWHDQMPIYAGDSWIWVAICCDTKLIPTWYVGKRDLRSAREFMDDLSYRMKSKIQLTSDGFKAYVKAIRGAFNKVDYRMLVKPSGKPEEEIDEPCVLGNPDDNYQHNSFVERHNLTMRMSMRRFIRQTNGYSKKLENHISAIALYFVYYNFCRVHETIETTPAIAAGITDQILTLEDVIEFTDEFLEHKRYTFYKQ